MLAELLRIAPGFLRANAVWALFALSVFAQGAAVRMALGVRRPLAAKSSSDQLLSIPEVAEILGVSPKTVRRLMRRGLPSVRFGRLVRFEQRDLLRWVEARKEA